MSDATFISTTIPYVNARPHLGHALEYVEADAYSRHSAAMGQDVFLLSGSDENSLKNVLAAEREGVRTDELVQRNAEHFEDLLDRLQVDVSAFIRTSVDPDHRRGAMEIWSRLAKSGDIYAKDYDGLYCVGCEQFYAPDELVDGKCGEHGVEPEHVSERNYFFRLSRYQGQILDAIDRDLLRIVPASRKNEVVSFVRAGLEDISISRSTSRAHGWGITVPDDPGQVMYVWIDALTNYINALRWFDGDELYQRYWADAGRRVHVVGKGVTRFHAVYWPAMLMSAGLPLPTDVVVHGYITAQGRKISKSLGNSADPVDLVERYGVDAVRYCLLADFTPFGDGDFSEERLVARYNTDLANGLGNLLSRTISMIVRYREGIVPESGPTTGTEQMLEEAVIAAQKESVAAMAGYDHRDAVSRVWALVRRANAYVDERAPWRLAKEAEGGQEALDTTLHHLVAVVRQIGRLLAPFLPGTAETLVRAVGTAGSADVPGAESWREGVAGAHLVIVPPLFPRIEVAP